jgi:hypothetical protein
MSNPSRSVPSAAAGGRRSARHAGGSVPSLARAAACARPATPHGSRSREDAMQPPIADLPRPGGLTTTTTNVEPLDGQGAHRSCLRAAADALRGRLITQQTPREVDAWLAIRRNVTGFSACLSPQVSTGLATCNSASSDSLSNGSTPWISAGCTGSDTPFALAIGGCGVAGPPRSEKFEVPSPPGDSPRGMLPICQSEWPTSSAGLNRTLVGSLAPLTRTSPEGVKRQSGNDTGIRTPSAP